MIETKDQVLSGFCEKARAFIDDPSLVSGIDLDDAAVTLKRYVLSELHDEQLGIAVGNCQKLIRSLDVAAVKRLLEEVEERLKD